MRVRNDIQVILFSKDAIIRIYRTYLIELIELRADFS